MGLFFLITGCTLPSATPTLPTSPPSPSPLAPTIVAPTLIPPTLTVVPNTPTVEAPAIQFLLAQPPAEEGNGSVEGLAFSPDGQILAALYEKGKVILWDVKTHQSIRSFAGRGETGGFGAMPALAFSPDGKFLATKANGVAPVLWEVASGQPIEVESALEHSDGLALSPDGRLLAYGKCEELDSRSSCRQYQIVLWEVNTRRPVGQALRFRVGATAPLGLLFSPDGKTLAVMSSGTTGSGKIELFDVETRLPIESPPEGLGQFSGMAFSPDGECMALARIGGVISIWDRKSHEISAEIKGEAGVVTGVTFSPDGKMLASRLLVPGSGPTPHEKVVLWDRASLQAIGQPLTGQLATGSETGFISLAFSPDGLALATGTEEGVIVVWNLAAKDFQAPQAVAK